MKLPNTGGRIMRVLAAGVVWLVLLPPPIPAQTDSTEIRAGPEYEAGSLHERLLGSEYRDAWTAPVRVPILDLDRFGGLEPVERGGGVQTRSLRFEAPDGREYNFRSVNKTYEHSVPDWARGTLVEWLRQDQTSAQHPGAVLVATSLLDAVGILNPGPQLFVMPDDPRLGEFREEFAGLLGTLELHVNEGENDEPLFAGSPKIAGGDRVLEHLDEEPEHRLDAPAFLAERLMSIYLGDWDRHIGQYRFARYERDGVYRWVAVPEDRDYAFVHHDGVLMAVARASIASRLIRFTDAYPPLTAMISNSPELVRRLLAPVDRATWDSVAHAVHAGLTDEAIGRAVATLPPEWLEASGDRLARTLRARRDDFLETADEFYRMLAAQAEVHATEQADVARVERHPDGDVTVRVAAPGNVGWGDRPYFERRFRPDETREIRVFLSEGDDRAVVAGDADDDGILVRVVGGEGDDVLIDSADAPLVLYDAEGDNYIAAGSNTRVDTRPYEPLERPRDFLPSQPRDWGSTSNLFGPELNWVSDVGLLVGGGPTWTRYGFRHDPYASVQKLSALVAPGPWRGTLRYSGDFRPENTSHRFELRGRATNADILRFHGFGNTSPALPDDSALTWYRRYEAAGAWHLPLASNLDMALGAEVSYSDPELEPGTRLRDDRPFGTDGLGEVGLRGGLERDTRDEPAFPRRGHSATVNVAGHVPLRDSPSPYGTGAADIAAYFPVPLLESPVVALRAGARMVVGDAPVHRAAFLGGRSTLRGFSHNRFAGDGAVFGAAELRVPVMSTSLVAQGTLGVSGFTDAGRVWTEGEAGSVFEGGADGGWHTAIGGAAWFTSPLATVTAEYAAGEERSLYLKFAFNL